MNENRRMSETSGPLLGAPGRACPGGTRPSPRRERGPVDGALALAEAKGPALAALALVADELRPVRPATS